MTETPKKLVHDIATGKTEYIDLTPAEIAQRDQDALQIQTDRAEKEATELAKAEAKSTAHAKLSALGLTGEEISAITE